MTLHTIVTCCQLVSFPQIEHQGSLNDIYVKTNIYKRLYLCIFCYLGCQILCLKWWPAPCQSSSFSPPPISADKRQQLPTCILSVSYRMTGIHPLPHSWSWKGVVLDPMLAHTSRPQFEAALLVAFCYHRCVLTWNDLCVFPVITKKKNHHIRYVFIT